MMACWFLSHLSGVTSTEVGSELYSDANIVHLVAVVSSGHAAMQVFGCFLPRHCKVGTSASWQCKMLKECQSKR